MPLPIPFAAIAGTWAYKRRFDHNAWWQPGSDFSQMLRSQGLAPMDVRPFLWTTDVNGAEGWRRWLSWMPGVDRVGDQRDWEVSGQWFDRYCDKVRDQPFVVFAHSHGGQVAKFAAFHGLYIPVLVTVATPVRKLETEIAPGVCIPLHPKFRQNIGYWLHLHSAWDDKMQWLGQLGDGIIRSNRSEPYANLNIEVPTNQHSRVLDTADPLARLWVEQGWLEAVKAALKTPEVPRAG